MAARTTTSTDDTAAKEPADTAATTATVDGGRGVPADQAEGGDKLVACLFPTDTFGPIPVPDAKDGDGKPVAYTLTVTGVIVRGEHLQAIRDAAAANFVKLRVTKADQA